MLLKRKCDANDDGSVFVRKFRSVCALVGKFCGDDDECAESIEFELLDLGDEIDSELQQSYNNDDEIDSTSTTSTNDDVEDEDFNRSSRATTTTTKRNNQAFLSRSRLLRAQLVFYNVNC